MNNAKQVANAILDVGAETDQVYTPIQLIKLTYLTQCWSLALTGKPLIDEQVQAWRYGPVIASVYHAVKEYRSLPVTQKLTVDGEVKPLSDEQLEIIRAVLKTYGHTDGVTLGAITSKKGTPWATTKTYSGPKNASISNDLISHYYKSLLNDAPKSKSPQP